MFKRYNRPLLRALSLALPIGIGLSMTPSTAKAYDWKVIPATICTLNGPMVNYPAPSTWAYSSAGSLVVTVGPSPTWVSCPVIRDVAQGTAGLSDLKVLVDDSDPNAKISCTGYSVLYNGSLVQTSNTASSGISFAGGYEQLLLTLNQSADWGYYNVECSLSRPSNLMHINAISWAEFGGDGF